MSTDAKPLDDMDLFTPEEAAKFLKLEGLGFKDPLATVKRMAQAGRIECLHVGNRIIFTRKQLMAYLMREKK